MNADIDHYLETVCNPQGRFRTLTDLVFIPDNRGRPEFRAGSNAVIFSVCADGQKSAMKCYTKPAESRKNRLETLAQYLNPLNSTYLSRFKFLRDEMYVFDHRGHGTFRDILLTEWAEGASLRAWLAEKCRAKDRAALTETARRFTRLGLWLLEQEWAHGDLKPDNIIVTPSGELRLIDYDNVFVLEWTGQRSPELGTPGFQHPTRNAKCFDRHLDDYSIALIATALYALPENPEWYVGQDDDERLLFDPCRAVEGHCPSLNRAKSGWIDAGKTALYQLSRLLNRPSPVIPELADALKAVLAQDAIPETALPGITPVVYREKGFYGYRTPQGKPVTEAIYDDAAEFREGLALVRIGRKRYYIGPDGKKRLDASAYEQAESFSEGLAAVRKGRKWGFIDPDGNPVIRPEFGQAHPFREGVAAVEKAGKWGYVDPTGCYAVKPLFDSAFDFREGVAAAGQNGRFGYIDRQGNWLQEPVYTFASGFRNGSATAEKNGQTIQLKKY
ncbi:WG repeat-containing protein, partial [Alistipes sp. OttesenSCG-928-L06]|nr:WG repeat-containing protein [Alistipes sp. OttesenSCG-928-L06]